MAFFLQFTEEQISQKPDIDEDLHAEVHTSMLGIFRALGIRNCALFVALADSEAELRASVDTLFGIDLSKRCSAHDRISQIDHSVETGSSPL